MKIKIMNIKYKFEIIEKIATVKERLKNYPQTRPKRPVKYINLDERLYFTSLVSKHLERFTTI